MAAEKRMFIVGEAYSYILDTYSKNDEQKENKVRVWHYLADTDPFHITINRGTTEAT